MPDITKAQLSAALPPGTIKDWWDATGALPAGVELAELLLNVLKGAFDAQAAYNVGQPVGSRVGAYELPVGSAPGVDPTTRLTFYNQRAGIFVRVVIPELDTVIGISA